MNIEIRNITEAGDIDGERIVLRATAECDIGRFAVFRCLTSEKEGNVQSGNVPNVFWFPDKKVAANDYIVLYTKTRANSEKKNDDGTTSHFFYWRLKTPIWTNGYTPVLVNTPTWKFAQSIKHPGAAA